MLRYVLIDYENVQPAKIASLSGDDLRIVVFVGANQSKVTFDAASTLQRMGEKAEYIKISGSGRNALDFHIAFYIGFVAATQSNASFCIVSKDAGFDPLIAHLKSKGFTARRVTDIETIAPATRDITTPKIPLQKVIANLEQRGSSKPRTVKTLTSTIIAIFNKEIGEKQASALIDELESTGFLKIEGNKLSYLRPARTS